jgi:hypothetical protein
MGAVDGALNYINDKSPQAKAYLADLAEQFNITDAGTLHKAYEYLKENAHLGAGALTGLTAIIGGGTYAHRKSREAVQNAMLAAGGLGLAGGLIGSAVMSPSRNPNYYPQAYPGRYVMGSDQTNEKEIMMRYHTKMAAAADYELGMKIASLAVKTAGSNDLMRHPTDFGRDLIMENPQGRNARTRAAMADLASRRLEEQAGRHARGGLAGLAGLAGLGGIGAVGHHAYQQHLRRKLMKRLAMGGGAAALLGGGGLAAHELLSDDDE